MRGELIASALMWRRKRIFFVLVMDKEFIGALIITRKMKR
jgi:hypothetical protein